MIFRRHYSGILKSNWECPWSCKHTFCSRGNKSARRLCSRVRNHPFSTCSEFSEKFTFLTLWRVRLSRGEKCSFFVKMGILFSCNHRFEVRTFASFPTIWGEYWIGFLYLVTAKPDFWKNKKLNKKSKSKNWRPELGPELFPKLSSFLPFYWVWIILSPWICIQIQLATMSNI